MSQFIDLNNIPINGNKKMTQDSRERHDSEEVDERKKFEKFQLYKAQQKRLLEMRFTKDNTNSSADYLINNIIKKVDSEAKFDKRINASNSRQTVANNVFNSSVSSISQSVMNSLNSNATNYFSNYSSSQISSNQTFSMPVNPNQQYLNNYQMNSQSYPQTLSLNMTPILSQVSNPVSSQTHSSSEWTQNQYNTYRPNTSFNSMIANQTMTTMQSYVSGQNSAQTTSISDAFNAQQFQSNEIKFVKKEIPLCLKDLTKMPPIYMQIWNYVKTDEISPLCDTNKLYAVLLSGGLPQTTLAQLWTYVNNTIPGQLTRDELIMALALIALIQNNILNPIEEVYKLSTLPIPSIQFFSNTTKTVNYHDFEYNMTDVSNQKQMETPIEQKMSTTCDISTVGKQISINLNINDDDFADFKSADFSSKVASYDANESVTQQDCLPNVQTSNSLTLVSPLETSFLNDDEFDDFKDAINDAVHKPDQNLNNIKENDLQFKKNSLSDALFSNISAIASINTTKPSDTISQISSLKIISNCVNSSENINKTNDNLLDNKENNDSNSKSTDKYSAFRAIFDEENSPKNEDFGDFLSHATNHDTESADSLQFSHQDNDCDNYKDSIRFQVMQTCRQLIHKAFNVLVVSHGEDSVMQAINTVEGNNFALDLFEIYLIAKRIWKDLRSKNKTNENFAKLITDIENTWNRVSTVFIKASLNIQFDDHNVDENKSSDQCVVCFSKSSKSQTFIKFGGYEYHSSCANLWLNCINPTLPQPVIQNK